MRVFYFYTVAAALFFSACAHQPEPPAPASVTAAAALSLIGMDGKPVTLRSQMGLRGLVVIAHSADCPISRKYSPVVENLRRGFTDRNIAVLYINTTEISDPARIREYRSEFKVETPIFFDARFAVAKQLRMERTTEAVFLSPEWRVLYQGAIDDRFDYEINRPVRARYLENAVQEWLENGQVHQPFMPAKGCALDY